MLELNADLTLVESIKTEMDYRNVVLDLTDDAVTRLNEYLEENPESDRDDVEEQLSESLNELIDQSQYAIYNHWHLPIIQYSPNDDAYISNVGGDGAAHVLKERGISGLHQVMAFYALEQDVRDELAEILDEQLDDVLEELQETLNDE